jgi:Segregation and condensation complex subunit ScpB
MARSWHPAGAPVRPHSERRPARRASLHQLSPGAQSRDPIARSGLEHIRGSASDSAVATLLKRGLIAHNPHHLLVTTPGLLEATGLSDLADLPPLAPEAAE